MEEPFFEDEENNYYKADRKGTKEAYHLIQSALENAENTCIDVFFAHIICIVELSLAFGVDKSQLMEKVSELYDRFEPQS